MSKNRRERNRRLLLPGPIGLSLLLLCGLLALGACQGQMVEPPPAPPEDPSLPPPKLDLPPPQHIVRPAIPQAYPDGTLSVYGLQLDVESFVKKEVRVRAHVTEVYSCPWAEEEEKERKAAERAKALNQPRPRTKPTHPPCKEPYFFVADSATARHKLLVVGFDPEKTKPPQKDQQVVLTGTFAKESDEGFMSPDGLLVLTTWEPVVVPEQQ